MAAFSNAVDIGFTYLETDAQVTSDGVVVLFHDDTLDAVTDGHGRMADLSWAEASRLRTTVAGQPLVRLDELIAAFPDAYLNIDAKTDEVVEPLVDLIVEAGRLDTTCLASFSDRRLHRMRVRAGDGLCTNTGRIAGALLKISAWLKGAVPLPVRGDAAQVPVSWGPFRFDTRSFIDEARRRGVAVHYWTIDDPAEMHRLLDLGATGLMSNRPTVLAQVLADRGLAP